MSVVGTGLGWRDKHDSGAGGRGRGVKGVMAMMRTKRGGRCKDELTSTFGHDARKARSSILGAKIERGQISMEFFPSLCDNPTASICFITGEFRTFCT